MNVFASFLAILCSLAVNLTSFPSPSEPTVILRSGDETAPITVEEYVCAVVMHEMPYTFEEEALKAQAVAARTHLAYCMKTAYPAHENADVCTDIGHCRGYITADEYAARYGDAAAELAYAAAKSAAESTAGEILTFDGQPILSVWHSSSRGFTEDSGNVWLESLPYLAPVSTPEIPDVSTVTFSKDRVRELLRSVGHSGSDPLQVSLKTNPYGRCTELTVGSVTLDGCTARRIFSLKSTCFTVANRGGELEFTVYGYGHGVGMSQHGANSMASMGYGYREILSHYYSGAVLHPADQ